MFGLGIISLIVFIAVVGGALALKRRIAEAMFLAWVAVVLIGGTSVFQTAIDSLKVGFTAEVIFPTMFFCFMSTLMLKTGIITRLIGILNSIFGRIAGGAGYVSTMASALMGMVSGSGPGNAAVSGSITIPWMTKTGYNKELATTIVAGNATLGASIPPSTVMFILLALPGISGVVSTSDFYLTALTGGMWLLLLRLLTVFYFVRKYKVETTNTDHILPLGNAFNQGWKSTLIFLGVLIPLLLTTGPISSALSSIPSLGELGISSIDMIVWIPILLTLITVLEGRSQLPKGLKAWDRFIKAHIKDFTNVGGTLLFSLAGGAVMTQYGLGANMEAILSSISSNLNSVVLLLVVGAILMVSAGPLSTTATIVALGSVCYTALTSTGMDPAIALTVIIMFAATEGSMPPSSAPLFVAAGISKLENPIICFKKLFFFYALGSALIATLIGTGILPVL
ncbi:TRAP transporter large permease subunit [Bacillus sp. Marseille-P3800]|uniref:TRAP transporter large permease subunit n=1 Tax=Bacillus sp. Marseille-P3800 TaxID=2014782 RepID=UPI000C06B59B|nr:TRAP transporter large permease subunit [Bacillus sp. Marseille-P3800]